MRPLSPGLLSFPRLTTLILSLVIALSSGTNYIYSAYSPQLAERLKISHTTLNVVGLAGNIGVWGTSPLVGRVIDLYGPRKTLLCASSWLLIGYLGIYYIFTEGNTGGSVWTSVALIICCFMTGAGGNAGETAGMNTTAKSFPSYAHATTTGLVTAGFGLSAFLFSTIAYYFFPGDTSSLLLFLSLGTCIPLAVGYVFLRRVPLHDDFPQSDAIQGDGDDAPLLGGRSNSSAYGTSDPLPKREILPRTTHSSTKPTPNVHGKKLMTTVEFWGLYLVKALLSGTGIMYINNVGTIARALYAYGTPAYSEVDASAWQAKQVSTISITSCIGRFAIGIVADLTQSKLGLPRSWSLVFVAALCAIAQLSAARMEDVGGLWIVSATLGLAYGGIAGLYPALVIQYFGIEHFSENSGWITTAPIFGGNLFTLMFGKILDSHTPTGGLHQCLEGRSCYSDVMYVSAIACGGATLLVCWLGWRDRQKLVWEREAIAYDSDDHSSI